MFINRCLHKPILYTHGMKYTTQKWKAMSYWYIYNIGKSQNNYTKWEEPSMKDSFPSIQWIHLYEILEKQTNL